MVGNRVDRFERFDQLTEPVDIDVEPIGDLAAGGLHIVDIVDVESAGELRRPVDELLFCLRVFNPAFSLRKSIASG